MAKKKIWQRYMLRPLIYMAAYRLMVALIVLLAVVRLVPNGPRPALVAGFLVAAFAVLSYFVYLRMDGLRIPRMKYYRPKKKDPLRSAASMNDHMDDEPQVTFEELETEEKDLCSLLSNLINLVIFAIASFII